MRLRIGLSDWSIDPNSVGAWRMMHGVLGLPPGIDGAMQLQACASAAADTNRLASSHFFVLSLTSHQYMPCLDPFCFSIPTQQRGLIWM
jgi:hypothetical protein